MISEKPANWGDTVTATCTMLKGDSPIQIEWALNGEPISHDYSDISIATSRRVSLLTIDAVTASHAGEYTCMASNAAGGTSFTATLAVNGTMRVPCSQNSHSLLQFSRCMRDTWPGSSPFLYDSSFDHRILPNSFLFFYFSRKTTISLFVSAWKFNLSYETTRFLHPSFV